MGSGRSEALIAGCGAVGLAVLVDLSFVGERTWGWSSAPLFVYSALVGLAGVTALAVGRWAGWAWARARPGDRRADLALGLAAAASTLVLLASRTASTAAALLVLACSVGALVEIHRRRRSDQRHERPAPGRPTVAP